MPLEYLHVTLSHPCKFQHFNHKTHVNYSVNSFINQWFEGKRQKLSAYYSVCFLHSFKLQTNHKMSFCMSAGTVYEIGQIVLKQQKIVKM